MSDVLIDKRTTPTTSVWVRGLIEPMSKADATDSDSTVRKHRQRGLIPWKPGQSGNPAGRPKGSRNKLSEDFIADLHESWKSLGKPALLAAAWTDPVAYVRVVASLIPRELEATATVTERMSDAQLEAIIARGIEGGLDPAATDEDAQIIQ